MGITISGMMGKGSIRHNNRSFFAANIDQSRTCQNVTICREDLKDVYHQEFDGALAEYNAKKKKTRDKIPDYYEHIRQSKQEKLYHEVIFQLGDKDSCGSGTEAGNQAAAILKEFAESFQVRNPHLRVFNSTLHMDEATPHVHIDFVPVATEQKRGLSTRVSLKQALKQQGYSSKGKGSTEWQSWMEAEKQILADLARDRGIEIVSLGGGRRHMDLPEYRVAAQRLEAIQEQVAAAEQSVMSLQRQEAELRKSCTAMAVVRERRISIDEIQPKRTLTGAVTGVTVEQVERLKAAAKHGMQADVQIKALDAKVRQLTADNDRLQHMIPTTAERMAAAQAKLEMKTEIRDLRSENQSLRQDLHGADQLLARIDVALGDIATQIPEALRPLVDAVRQLIQGHVRSLGLRKPDPEQEQSEL